MTLKINRAPLLSNIKLCATFHCHMWIQTGVTVWKLLNRVMTSVTLTSELDLLRVHDSHLPLVITPENFRMIWWQEHCQQGKSEGFNSCEWPSNLAQIWSKSSIFQPVWPWNLMDDHEKWQGTSSILHQALCIISNPLVNWNRSYRPGTLNLGIKRRLFCPMWPWNLTDDLEKR